MASRVACPDPLRRRPLGYAGSIGSRALLLCLLGGLAGGRIEARAGEAREQKAAPGAEIDEEDREGESGTNAPEGVVRAQPALSPEDLQQVRELMATLAKAFLKGDVELARTVLPPAGSGPIPGSQQELLSRLEREFKATAYQTFDILEIQDEDQLDPLRFSVWVRLAYTLRERQSDQQRKPVENLNHQNASFVFLRDRNGRLALEDSPFFRTLGQRSSWYHSAGRPGQGWNVADLLLLFSSTLALLGFWVWMGYEVFRLRPRRPLWRFLVLAVPLLGAMAFFLGVYLAGWRRTRGTAGA